MSQFKNLTDSELTAKIKSLARDERELTRIMVEYIAEVDRRKIFLARAYSSLFDYLTKEIGYSAGAAQRRIDAARLLRQVPEVATKIETGAINLAQISKLQRASRLMRKEGRAVSADIQSTILTKLENKGIEQTDLILAQEFQMPVKIEEKRRVQRDESVRVEFTFTKEEIAIINRAREILSHKTGGGLKATMLEMALRTVKATEPKVKAITEPKVKGVDPKVKAGELMTNSTTATVAVDPTSELPKTVTPRLKREILARDKSCRYRDAMTGKVCGATQFLEIDHIQPRFANGSNSTENLRVFCKNHNIYRYEAGL